MCQKCDWVFVRYTTNQLGERLKVMRCRKCGAVEMVRA